jgi:hypothetical protein
MNAGTLVRSVFAIQLFALGCGVDTALPDQSDPIPDPLRRIGNPDDPPPPPPPRPLPPPAPHSVDLKMDGTMRFYGGGSNLGVQLNVFNIGDTAATVASGMVNIGGFNASATLHQYWDGSPPPADTLLPGKRGYLMAYLPLGALQPCQTLLTHIDTTKTMQFASGGAPDPFVNDEANVSTQCLGWNTPITSDNFSISDPVINGKTIMQIVSSLTIGRLDQKVCSECHFANSQLPYSPPVSQFGNGQIWPDDVINGRTWKGPGGYARSFLLQPTDMPTLRNSKGFYLQELIRTWIEHGERGTRPLVADPGGVVGVFTKAP